MTLAALQEVLDRGGGSWGCRFETGQPETAGYIVIARRRVSPSEPFDAAREPERDARWRASAADVAARPYQVSIYTVDAAADDAERTGQIDYMAPEDYGPWTNLPLADLGALPDLLAAHGKSVDDLLHQSELLAP